MKNAIAALHRMNATLGEVNLIRYSFRIFVKNEHMKKLKEFHKFARLEDLCNFHKTRIFPTSVTLNLFSFSDIPTICEKCCLIKQKLRIGRLDPRSQIFSTCEKDNLFLGLPKQCVEVLSGNFDPY